MDGPAEPEAPGPAAPPPPMAGPSAAPAFRERRGGCIAATGARDDRLHGAPGWASDVLVRSSSVIGQAPETLRPLSLHLFTCGNSRYCRLDVSAGTGRR